MALGIGPAVTLRSAAAAGTAWEEWRHPAVKLQHLVSLDAVVRHDLNVTRAAASLNASQPALTMQIQLLEAELGTELFVRRRNRFEALSPAGEALVPIAAKVVEAAAELRRAARALQHPFEDTLTVAASGTLARFVLPPILGRFSRSHPSTKLRVRHGPMPQLLDLVASGGADLSVSTRPRDLPPGVLSFPFAMLGWMVLAKAGHPLLMAPDISLMTLAAEPLITYDVAFTSHGVLMDTFAAAGLAPRIALMEADSDIMKRYVRLGLGVAVVKDGAFDPEIDVGLGARKLAGIIPETSIEVGVRRHAPLAKPALAFMDLLKPRLASAVRRGLAVPYR